MKRYGVRTTCGSMLGVDISAIRKSWCGKIIVIKDDLDRQVFDMIPPPDFIGEETYEFAKGMKEYIEEEFGHEAEIIEIPLD